MNTNEKKISDLEALLPWHAAGTLDSREADEVERALASDPELARRFEMVREEMTETILLNEALGAPSARAMDKLFAAIDKERKVVRAGATHGFAAWLSDLLTPRTFAIAGAAAAIVIMLQAGVITQMMLDRGDGTFETASAPTTRGIDEGAFALVRFAPQANMGEITSFLNSHGALIVDGPRPGGPGGMYKIRIARMALSKDELDRAVKELQSASSIVTFATPTE